MCFIPVNVTSLCTLLLTQGKQPRYKKDRVIEGLGVGGIHHELGLHFLPTLGILHLAEVSVHLPHHSLVSLPSP